MTRTAELTLKLLDSVLDEAESAELNALVAADPVAEAESVALLELEAELRGLRTDLDLAGATLAKIEAAQAEQTASAVMSAIAKQPAPAWTARPAQPAAPAPRRRRAWAPLAALAACAAALFVAFGLDTSRPPVVPGNPNIPEPTAYAKLARKTGDVAVLNAAGEVIPTDEGGDLPEGFTVRTSGDESMAVVELLREKARFEIESDSVVRFEGAPDITGKPLLFLAAGQITAAVNPRPDDRPLVIWTPIGEVFARGATFVVSSAAPDSARVDTKHGKVELVRAAAPKPVAVPPGRAAVLRDVLDRINIERSLVADRTPKRLLAAPGIRDAVFSPDGSEVWVATARVFGRWTENGALRELGLLHPRKGNDGFAAFSRDKTRLLTFRGERDDSILVRELPDGGEKAAVNARPTDPRLWTVAPNAAWVAIADPKPGRRVRVFDLGTGGERVLPEFDDPITVLAASPDAKHLATALHTPGRGANATVVVHDVRTGNRLYALSGLRRQATAMTFSPDGRTLAVGYNGLVQLWDTRRPELPRLIAGFERPLTCLSFSPDGKRLAAGTQDGHVWVWDVDSGRQTQLIEVGARMVRSVAFSPNGKQLVTAAAQASVAVWDVNEPSATTDLQ